MNILFGLYHPDEGEIRVNGQPVHFHSPRDAVHAGLGMVHQHFMLIPRFTVTENVILGSEGPDIDSRPRGGRAEGRRNRRIVRPECRSQRACRRPAGWHATAGRDPARALPGQPTLILDEPTALLTPQEVEELYVILLTPQGDGGTIIFITHKLREVAAISDRVTVIRRGKTVGTPEYRETTSQELAELMVGRAVCCGSIAPPAPPRARWSWKAMTCSSWGARQRTRWMWRRCNCVVAKSSAFAVSKATASPN